MEKIKRFKVVPKAEMDEKEVILSGMVTMNVEYWRNIILKNYPLNWVPIVREVHGIMQFIDIIKWCFKQWEKTTYDAILALEDLNKAECVIKKNYGDAPWHEGVYYGHPRRNDCLIEKSKFEQCILNEQLHDIESYIQEHFALESFEAGLVISNSKSHKRNANVCVEGVQVENELGASVQLSKDYHIKMENAPKLDSESEHYWLDEFQDVKMAVDKKCRSYERCIKMDNSFSIQGKIMVLGNGGGAEHKKNKKTTFFIKYKCKSE